MIQFYIVHATRWQYMSHLQEDLRLKRHIERAYAKRGFSVLVNICWSDDTQEGWEDGPAADQAEDALPIETVIAEFWAKERNGRRISTNSTR